MVLSQNVIIPFLPISSVIIEYVHYKELDLDQTLKIGTFVQKSPNYAAFIIKSDNRIIFYDLGDAKEIYDIITSLPNEIEKDSYSFIASKKIGDNLNSMLKDLRKKLIDPLMEELTNIYHVIISPDYYLNYLPFGILIEDNDSFLIENFLISYLSSSRDILQFCDCNNEESNPPLVFASPDFNYLYPEQVDSIGEESEKYWGELEYAKNEGRIVGSKLNINEITGHTVNEDLIINCQSPIILHICSHGFFFDNLEELPQRLQSIAINSNPLLHSRFVVSGANAWIHGIVTPPEIGKGHIFAEEITGLNLNHTQMVVLSLCKSGKGELMSGEGVFGLRRSFVISGAKTLIMSLFDIDDMWTVTLINDFYDYLLSGKGKAESLIRTQINLMKQINHPYYWGGFICQGDFKQLQ